MSILESPRAIHNDQTIPQERFVDFVDLYSDSVYRFCRSLTYSKEDADDLFQETFIKALEQLPKICASGNPQGFLFSTALYLWKSWKRKYARRRRLAPEEPLNDAVAGGADMEDDIMARDEIRIVRELVDDLPDKFRIPVLLYYTSEMSIADIASLLAIPAGTVKSRLHKARKILKKRLEMIQYEK
jgi:RNA polymerase sigma-70 factor (ECF subfamily)